jgi:hypothetical protein
MMKFLAITIFLVFVSAGSLNVHVAYAQENMDEASAAQNSAFSSATSPTAAATPTASAPGAKVPTPPSLPKFTGDSIFGTVMIWVMGLFSWLLGIAVLSLDYSVYYTVVNMGFYIGQLNVVGEVWTVLRDIANILLIFGFLVVGISTIISYDLYGGWTKMIPKLIIAAILINFSLFFAQAIIDVGNLFATQFYTQINGGIPAGNKGLAGEGISSAILKNLGMATLYKPDSTVLAKLPEQAFVGLMGTILFLVASFVMFALALMLVARFVILLFLIILAPIGVAGWAIPQLSGLGRSWWNMLFEQTVTAPVLLLLLYIALRIITAPTFLTGLSGNTRPDWYGFLKNSETSLQGFAGLLLSFIIAMGLLMVVIIASKRLSAFGAGWATVTAGKLSFGASAWAGRTTVGWAATRAGKGLGRTWVARVPVAGTGLVKGLDRIGKSSFDVRGTTALKNFPGGAIDAGKAQKGGYQADLKARIKTREEYAENIITGKDLDDDQKKDRARLEAQIQLQRKKAAKADNEADIEAANAEVKRLEEEIEKIENSAGTKSANQRRYASFLSLGQKPDHWINSLNPASNTEAAKNIRDKAKKGKSDKDLAAMFKRVVEESATETAAGVAGGAAAGAPAAGGGATTGGGGTGGGGGGAPGSTP